MEVPKGVVFPKSGQVYKLRKFLYGLRQASRHWYEKLSTILIASGYTQSQFEFSLFTKQFVIGAFTVILVYVEDMILTKNDTQETPSVKCQLDCLSKLRILVN